MAFTLPSPHSLAFSIEFSLDLEMRHSDSSQGFKTTISGVKFLCGLSVDTMISVDKMFSVNGLSVDAVFSVDQPSVDTRLSEGGLSVDGLRPHHLSAVLLKQTAQLLTQKRSESWVCPRDCHSVYKWVATGPQVSRAGSAAA